MTAPFADLFTHENTKTEVVESEEHRQEQRRLNDEARPAIDPNEGLHQIKLFKNPNYVRDGLRAYGKLLRKYEFTPTLDGPFAVVERVLHEGEHHFLRRWLNKPEHISHRTVIKCTSSDAQTGEVSAQDVQHDTEYLAQLRSTHLPKHLQDTTKHNIFDPHKSQTFRTLHGSTWNITYGSGSSASGTVGTDTVVIGGLRIKNQAIELAGRLSDSFVNDASDGLLGLAWPQLNTVRPHPVNTPVENMIFQADIPQSSELFTAYLTNSNDNVRPFYTFGYIDADKVANRTIYYTPIDNSQGFWQIASGSATIDGITVSSSNATTAIMDTGTTLALVDDATCSAIYAAIPGAKQSTELGGWVFPTSNSIDSLPAVALDIGGTACVLHREDLAFADAGAGYTYGGVQSRGTLPFNIYGDTVLKSMYAIFDQGGKRFGFVPRDETVAVAVQGDGSAAVKDVVVVQADGSGGLSSVGQ